MSVILPKKLLEMEAYDPSENKYDVKLDANESPLDLPPELTQEIAQAIVGVQWNRYPDPSASRLLAAAAEYYGVQPENVAGGCGSDELISIVVNCFCQRGQSVLTVGPDFSMYRFYAQLDELEVLQAEKNERFVISPQQIIDRAKQVRPQILIFSNPCNPTGQGLRRQQVQQIIDALPNVLIVLDEAYMDFWNESMLPGAVKNPHVLVLKTMSKACGLAAVRLGFVLGAPELIQQIHKSRSPFNLNAMTQLVGEMVLRQKEYLAHCAAYNVAQRKKLEALLTELAEAMPNVFQLQPTHTNFAVLRTPYADTIYQKLLERSICVRNFSSYGFLRITAGSDEENQAVVQAIKEIVEVL